MRNLFIALTRNPISLIGSAITTASAVLIITLFSLEIIGFRGSPYVGILAYLVVPMFFGAGLLLIPVGIWRERKRARKAEERGEPPPGFPILDLNSSQTRKMVLVFFFFTLMNVVILTLATYKGVEIMDSTEFCGTTCHDLMKPEYTAYRRSPHARVKCVECHIGSGASWFAKSKLSGAWQVVSATFDLYPRPIPSPVHDLRPARETCEQCHWPTKFVGDRLKVSTHYSEDEANTELKSVILLRVGGMQGRASQGIHWHVDPNIQIRYRSDEKRETIYDVELTLPDGTVKTFSSEGLDGAEGEEETGGEWRLMDCVDCHNRPTHVFLTPEQEVDDAIRRGEIDRSLPFIRREGVRALQRDYASHEEARPGIHTTIDAFYRESYPQTDREKIEVASRVLGDIYTRNVFPSMNVFWGTYPSHIGHTNNPGCFRCHDDEHATEEGEEISQDCFTCHTLLAIEEENPEVLETLQP